MELNKESLKLLRWLSRQDQSVSFNDFEKKCPYYDYERLTTLIADNLVTRTLSVNNADNCTMDNCLIGAYRISDKGKSCIEERNRQNLKRFCEFLTIVISIAALFGVSAIREWACKAWEIIHALLP